MAVKVFEPQHGACGEPLGMVLLNHAGSKVSQDTGRDAQEYANTFGMPVVAADRPGSGGLWPDSMQAVRQATPKGYVHEMTKLGKKIGHQLDQLGVNLTIISGRSAGALGALALTRTETISSQGFVFAAEPVACESMPVMMGAKRYRTYNRNQKTLHQATEHIIKPENAKLPPLQAASRLMSIVPAFYHDRYHNKQLWASDAAVQYAEAIAEEQPDIDMTIEFATHSLVADEDLLIQKFAWLELVRPGIHVSRTEHTTHASYDDHRFMITRMSPVIDRAITALG